MILYALYVCLLYSRFIKNHMIWNLKGGSLISEVILLQGCVLGGEPQVINPCPSDHKKLSRENTA
jgi:hypothetical protein